MEEVLRKGSTRHIGICFKAAYGHTVIPSACVLYDVGKSRGKAHLPNTLRFIFKAASLKTFVRPSCTGYFRQMEDPRSDCPWTHRSLTTRGKAHMNELCRNCSPLRSTLGSVSDAARLRVVATSYPCQMQSTCQASSHLPTRFGLGNGAYGAHTSQKPHR